MCCICADGIRIDILNAEGSRTCYISVLTSINDNSFNLRISLDLQPIESIIGNSIPTYCPDATANYTQVVVLKLEIEDIFCKIDQLKLTKHTPSLL